MYIKKLILDGFKSYGKRTEVDGFDKEFTAITGLNGTGKSNILDSICFVLGISNLGQVRASTLQELVYKNGQAGITKASVTIVFDNTDANNCPVGYESCKEITVSRQVCVGGGGKNKYFINGKTVLQKKVMDLFCSVQMNVNNANFLIMQGRITKVLNMKPMEILSMIEEASGTSLYETKRELTTKVMEKKDSKIKEMDSLLHEEINPRMKKLRDEQAQYQEFQKLVREIDHLTHISISWRWTQYKKALENCEKNIALANTFVANSHQEIENNNKEMEEIEEECKLMQDRIVAETGGELKDLEAELTAKSKTEATANGAKKSAAAELDRQKRQLKTNERDLKRDQESLKEKEDQQAKVGDLFESLKAADEKDREAFAVAEKRFQAISAGLDVGEDGEATSLNQQLITNKSKLTEATTTIRTSEMDLRHQQKLLRAKESSKTTSDASYQKNKQNVEQREKEINEIKAKLSQIQYEEGTYEELDQRRNTLNNEVKQMEVDLDRKGASRFEVNYADPEPNFDRRKVKGMVCKLFEVNDPKYLTALSTCGGGALTNLVVDDEVVGKKILERGKLQARITIIPISKIRGRSINPGVVARAQQMVGADNCVPAMDVISYHPSLKSVMEHVFGGTFICSNMATAKRVTYDQNILTRTITLDGDVCDPQGTLSGGAASRTTPTLQQVAEIKAFSRLVDAKRVELRHSLEQLVQIEPIVKKYNELKTQLEGAEYALNASKEALAQTSYQKHQQEIEDARKLIENLTQTIATAKEEQGRLKVKIQDIETNLKDAKGYRDRQLKEAKDNMQKLKAKSDKSKKEWQKHEQEAETLKLEIENLKLGIEKAINEKDELAQQVAELEQKYNQLVETGKSASAEIEALKVKIKEQKDSIKAKDQEMRKKVHRKEKLLKRNDDLALQIKKKESELSKIQNDNKDGLARIAALEAKYKWIVSDKQYFGAKNTKYDYSKETPQESGEKLQQAEEKRNKMEKRINVKAMMLLEREEEQLQDVRNRKDIVESDRKKIKGILKGLDAEKMEQLRQAWQEVDKNFGSIFSVLLPGAQATLVPSPGLQFYQGLNIRVGFNGVWKEALGELSGGQRSLVALSLILAMLKYKPAPIYILDEVDAALDMSHTQNIGVMLKKHFSDSQFVIVSLKDGMFNNANVLFKTKFENGVSGVVRNVNPNRR